MQGTVCIPHMFHKTVFNVIKKKIMEKIGQTIEMEKSPILSTRRRASG